MSVNKYRPHVWIVPEDRANQQLASGFRNSSAVDVRAVGISSPAGGWRHVLEVFAEEYVPYLRRHADGHVILLLDFDDEADRREECEKVIPDDLKGRVFVVGSSDEPETLRANLGGTLEDIGEAAARDCVTASGFWNHPQLTHNAAEVTRMTLALKRILFGS